VIRLALHPDSPGRVYNIGATKEVTIRQLAERIKTLTNSHSPIVTISYAQAYAPGFEDMRRRVPDISRVNELVGWQPTRSLDEILASVIEYMGS
jgi:UDP-glucose 4-epimerase